MTAKSQRSRAKSSQRPGLFKRILDWLFWDGEDDPEELAASSSARATTASRPPRTSVDSIDWQAYAEGRPQKSSFGLQAVQRTPCGDSTAARCDEVSAAMTRGTELAPTERLDVGAVVGADARPMKGNDVAFAEPTTAVVMAAIHWD